MECPLANEPSVKTARDRIKFLEDRACREALLYAQCGVDSVIVENMFDLPYSLQVGPEVVSVMTRMAQAVKRVLPPSMPVGLQILAGANKEVKKNSF